MKNIAILTRTYNRPNYFKRCRKSVEDCNMSESHYIIYNDTKDLSYINNDEPGVYIYTDFSKYNVKECKDKTIAKYNLMFNEAYDSIKEDWIFHLDDDNILTESAFTPIKKFLNSEHDLIVFRYRNDALKRTIPSAKFIKQGTIQKNHIDTLCFLVKTELAKKVLWNPYKGGDYEFVKSASKLAKSVKFVNCVVGKRDNLGLGSAADATKNVNIIKTSHIKEPTVEKNTITQHEKPYVGTIVAINCCKSDLKHLNKFKESKMYRDLKMSDDFYLLEYYRGSETECAVKNKLHLVGDERYDKLHFKTYRLMQWCYKNFEFDRIVKLDCNWMTYDNVGLRTRTKLCSPKKVEHLLYNKNNKNYIGTNGRYFKKEDYISWMRNKRITNTLDIPEFMNVKTWYYCGKAYSCSYDFAKYIATQQVCADVVKEHSLKSLNGYYEFSIEDYMVGRMFVEYLNSTKK
jgi:hypothetical protein